MHFGLKNTASGTKHKQIHPVRVELKAAEGPQNKTVFGLSTPVAELATHSLKISRTRSSWKVSTNIPRAKLVLTSCGKAPAGHKGIWKPSLPKVACGVSSTLPSAQTSPNTRVTDSLHRLCSYPSNPVQHSRGFFSRVDGKSNCNSATISCSRLALFKKFVFFFF